MAIAFVATRATPSGVFSATGTFGFNLGTNATVGNVLIMTIALDNTSPVLNGNQFVSVTDGAGNTWIPIVGAGAGAGSNTGTALYTFFCRPSRQITTTTGVFVFGAFANATTRAAVIIDEFSGVSALVNPSFNGVVAPGVAIGINAAPTAPTITPTVTGQLVYATAAIETNTAVTGDADTTNGAWSAVTTIVSNSGTDATSQTVTRQYKIVTAAGAQNWTATTAATHTWAAGALVLAPAATHVAPNFPEGNPHYTTLAGFEGLPTSSTELPIDQGTGYIYNYLTLPDELGSSYQVAGAEFVTPPELSQHHIAYDWFYQPNITDGVLDDLQTIYLPLRRAHLNGATLNSGLTTDAAALAALNAVGGDFAIMAGTGTQNVDLYFDTTQLTASFLNSRIVNFGIQYVAYRDNSASQGSPSQGFSASYTDSLANAGAGTGGTIGYWISAYYKKDNKYETRWFGETNLFPRTADRIASAPGAKPNMNAPWRVQDLLHMNNGDESVKFTITGQASQTDLLQTTVFFDYVVMVVQLAPERRLGAGIRTVNNTYIGSGLYPFSFDYTRFQDPINTSKLATASAPNNALGIGYSLLVREAVPASESDYLRLQTGTNAITSLFEALGPSTQMKAFTQPRESLYSQPDTAFVPVVNGARYGAIQNFSEYTSSIMVFDELSLAIDGPAFGGYIGLAPLGLIQVYNGHPQVAVIQAPGGVQYTYLKTLIKPDPALTGFGGATAIVFTVEQPALTVLATVTLTPATWTSVNDVPDKGFGWKELSAVLSVPITPAAGSVFIRATSGGAVPANTPWYWAAAAPDANDGLNGYAGINGYDYAGVLSVALPVPTVTMSTTTQGTMPRASATCLGATEKLPHFVFTNGAQYDQLIIYRYDTMGEPIYVTTIFGPANNTPFTDVAAPWDIPVNTLKYQIYGCRTADNLYQTTTVTWNDISPNPGAALSLAYNPPQTGTIGQSLTNYFGFELIYAPVDSSSLKLSWKSLNGSTQVPLHGIDKQVQLRELEQRGLSVTFTVLVDHFGVVTCDTSLAAAYANLAVNAPKEQPAQGAQAMSPIVFGGDNSPLGYRNIGLGNAAHGMALYLRELERLGSPITLKLPGGHTRLMNIEIGDMMITPWSGLYMADITLTDAAPLDFDATLNTVPITVWP